MLFYGEGLGAAVAHGFAQGPCVLKPTSRGNVSLRGASPDVAPRILHNYLTTDEDRRTMIDDLRIALDIASRPAMRNVITSEFVVPEGRTDADLLEFARHYGQTLYHPTSTCAIGAVVDSSLRVLETEGLRVADASVMPTVVRGNTNAPTIMIAEKAAELIHAGTSTLSGAAAG